MLSISIGIAIVRPVQCRAPRPGGGPLAETDDIATVLAFAESWRTRDADRIASFLAEDAIWENVPIEAISGKNAIREKLYKALAHMSDIEWIVHAIARSERGAVLTERLDRIWIGDKRIDLRLMGIFELRDGLITLWRDYFDLRQYEDQLGERRW